MISVVVTYYVLPGKKDEYMAIMMELIEKTQQEDGCVYYDMFEAVDGDGMTLTLIEVWKDQAALDYHMETGHFKTALAALTPLREDRRIRNVFKKAY